jgi:anaerobic ribonucleoside-triphosphate reductase
MNLEIARSVEPEFVELLDSIPLKLREMDGIVQLDPLSIADQYFRENVADMSIDPNANVNSKSPLNFSSEIFKPILKFRSYYLLWKRLRDDWDRETADRIIRDSIEGALYFHDIVKIDCPYCFAPDTSFMMHQGRPYGWLPSLPPKKLSSFMGMLREVTLAYAQENAGAIGIANALINMAFYTKGHTDKEIEDELQQTIHIFHSTLRTGGDSAFTNISLFDAPTISETFKESRYPDFSRVADNMDEIMRVQMIYARFFARGSPENGRPYRFPVTTVNIKIGKDSKIIDREFFEKIADLNRDKCVFNWHIGEKIASCCRLTSDLSELKNQIRMDSFGNGGLSIGSHRVVTVNLHRVALIARKDKRDFFEVLENKMADAEKLLVVHKRILKDRIASGLLKFFNIGWANLNMFFSTFGFAGLHDAYEVHADCAGKELDKEVYVTFASKVLQALEVSAKDAGRRNKGFAFNVEEIPGENAGPKLAKKDSFLFGTERKLLSNQMVPLYENVSMFDRLDISARLMNIVSGGSILHLNIQDELTGGANRELLRRLIEDYKLPHFALNRGFSTCPNNHTATGIFEKCPVCGEKIATYTTRIVGFFTDTKDWIKVRREFEFPRRIWYNPSIEA